MSPLRGRRRLAGVTGLLLFLALASPVVAERPDVSVALGANKRLMVKMPLPAYPPAAAAQHLTGRCIFDVTFDPKTGKANKAVVIASTGNGLMDFAALKAVLAWSARPGSIARARVPFTFSFKK